MAVADAKYVSFTTYRRSGEAVATAVWFAPLPDGRAGFTTAAESGKVKRLRHTAKVSVVPSDVRGRVAPDAEAVEGTATVVSDGPDYEAVVAAMARTYGLQFRLVHLGSALKARLGRGQNAAVVVSFDG